MESYREIKDGVLLLDHYGECSELLRQSFRDADFKGPVVALEDNDFFPEDVISLYEYFCGDFSKSDRVLGRARYFNEINVPDYWEISGNNANGKVHDLYRERGRIFYTEPRHKRLVKVVDWLDETGIVRASDHYNRYGALYAKTFFNKDGKRFCRAYFDAEGKEALLENYVTGDITLNRDGKVYVYKGKVELALKLLEELGAMESRLFYNSLSTPLFISERMPESRKADVLFWQEGARSDIPGNMQMILEGKAKRTREIYVQNKDSYQKFLELGIKAGGMIKPLGFAYAYSRENSFGKDILICTNSDRIEKCEELVQAFPEFCFHIAAITEMSSKLTGMAQYSNVMLYPGVSSKMVEELFGKCDYYLDINHESEILSAVKQAFMHNQLIIGFRQTLHNRAYTAPEHVFDSCEEMIFFLRKVMGSKEAMRKELTKQKKAAMAEKAAAYKKVLK